MTSQKTAAPATILILDFGSQYTQLIARRVRELGFYSKIVPGTWSLEKLRAENPRVLILSGGPSSVYDPGAPELARGFFDYQAESKIPTLGVCYGLQLMTREFGGKVEKAKNREYGRMLVIPTMGTQLFGEDSGWTGQGCHAWMSHGDELIEAPAGFNVVAKSEAGAVAAIECPERLLYAVQFHPEVTHTERGTDLISHFLRSVAGLKPDWNMYDVLQAQIEAIRTKVGPDQHVICALSGGVDSAVAATLVHRAIGDRLHCVFVDNGLLRLDEQARVMKLFKEQLHLPVECFDASERFLSQLSGVEDPERKRKIIGAEFIAIFDEVAHRLEKELGHLPAYLVQGTLYPDVIESLPPSGERSHSVTIKSHHNVGGLPSNLRFGLIEPLRELFKDEVREMGRQLGVPDAFLKRHPFPGPGLAVRVIGAINREALDILCQVDEIFINALREEGIYDKIWQAFAVFLPIKSVGVQGDGRTHAHVVALRAVTSSDGMTADWYPFEPKFLARVSARICNEVRGVNRVVYDISSKPPATIEWE